MAELCTVAYCNDEATMCKEHVQGAVRWTAVYCCTHGRAVDADRLIDE